MAIQEHRLDPGQQGVAPIEMAPARLDHSDFGIGKEIDCTPKQMRRRHEVGIENANKLSACGSESVFERSCLETDAIDPMDQFDIKTALAKVRCTGCGNFARFVGRIIQYLDLQILAWIIKFADRSQ